MKQGSINIKTIIIILASLGLIAAIGVGVYTFAKKQDENLGEYVIPLEPIDPNDPGSSAGGDIPMMYKKPVIYLYPEQQTEVSVSLGNPELITTSYPKYQGGWNVLANPDGTLKDLSTNRELYSLYWEGKIDVDMPSSGFIVKGEDSAKFLEEKLEILGLNAREAEEFIIYWLPKLESAPYNHIYFVPTTETDQKMPLNVTPKPDTVIRIAMAFKPLSSSIKVEEQKLEPATRQGFTVVEWGGIEL